MAYNSLRYFYELNFSLKIYYNYSSQEIESWMPFERQAYITLLNRYVEEKKAEMESRKT